MLAQTEVVGGILSPVESLQVQLFVILKSEGLLFNFLKA